MAKPIPAVLDPSRPPPTEPPSNADLWVLTKQIDELGGEWSFPIFTHRAVNFLIGWREPIFYEPISGFERLGLEALLKGKAVAYCPARIRGDVGVSIKVFPSIFGSDDGLIPVPGDSESPIGEHFMAVLGVKDIDTLIIRNSWSGWRRQAGGVGYLTRQYFEEYGTEAMLARPWEYGPDFDTVEALLRCEDKDTFNRLWRRKRRYGTRSVPGNPDLSLSWYGCWSLDLECSAEILMLKVGRRISAGVAILIHRSGESLSELSDIFVWPSYRRQGYGRLLDEFAAERARKAKSVKLGIYLWNSDAVKGKDRAVSFMRSANYTEIEESSGSQLVAYGRREIV